MDFTPLEKNMDIISALDDEPNDVGGLTATELKAKFDEGGNAIKDYLNNTMIPEVKVALGDKAGKDELQGLVLGQIPDGTITEDKLSEELKEQIGSMAPAADVFTKTETLSPETAEMYGLNETAVPDDVFIILALGVGKYGYGITVKYPDGTPAAGLSVTGVTDRLGKAITTDKNGYFLAVSENNKISFSIKSPYFDIANISNQAVNAAGVLTRQTVEFVYKTYENYILLTTSQVMKFSRACKLDLTAVGGGGGGVGPTGRGQYGAGGGGGGGYAKSLLDVNILKDEILKIVIGSGGPYGTYTSTGTIIASNGGITSIEKNDVEILTVNGGSGGKGWFGSSGTTAGGIGNGNGGAELANGTNATIFIFNDQSLGLAGGGGGGGSGSGNASQQYSGQPFGARGSYARDDVGLDIASAGAAGLGGGGGGSGSGANNAFGSPSKGGAGGVYLRWKDA